MNSIELVDIPSDRRVWVVRADKGEYYEHFVDNDVVAISQLDRVGISQSLNFKEFDSQYKDCYESLRNIIGKDTALTVRNRSSIISNVSRFVDDIDVGDVIVTLSDSFIKIGRVLSDPFYEVTPLKVVKEHGSRIDIKEMRHGLRRKVNWSVRVSRSSMPMVLRHAFGSHHTVFNLDEYIQEVHHLMYPFFRIDNGFYFSLKINQEEGIKNYPVSQLFSFLSDVEGFARLGEDAANEDNSDHFNDLTLETRATFMSPGDIWGMISNLPPEAMSTALVGYAMIFGNKFLGMDGLIDVKSRQKIIECILKRWEEKGGIKIKNAIKPSLPERVETTIEDNSKDIPSVRKRRGRPPKNEL